MDTERAFAAGDDITRRSFEIIRGRLGSFSAPPDILSIIVRVAHTTGDVAFATTFLFSAGSAEAGIAALKEGRPVITDVGMVRTGVRARTLGALGSRCLCLLDDPETTAMAAELGMTRSAAGMRRAADAGLLDGAVAAIGNAPTALFELMDLARAGKAMPALVVGVPVGFVGALESKEALAASGLTHVTNLSERGGSPIAAAIVNGLADLALEGAKR